MGTNTNSALKLERTLTPIQQLLQLDNTGRNRPSVPFRPELMREFGSMEAALLFQQIIYLWHSFGKRPFFMFSEPCQDDWYDADRGNSWQDQFGLSKYKIKNALDSFARKTTKTDLPSDMKETSCPVWYYKDRSNHTWYVVDETATVNKLCEIYDINPVSILGSESNQQSGLKPDSVRGNEGKRLNSSKSKNFTSGSESLCSRNISKSLHIDSSKNKNQPPTPSKKMDERLDGILNEFNRLFETEAKPKKKMLEPILQSYDDEAILKAVRNCASMPLGEWRNPKARGNLRTIFGSKETFEGWLNYRLEETKAQCYVPPETVSEPAMFVIPKPEKRTAKAIRAQIETAKKCNLSKSVISELQTELQTLVKQGDTT